MGSLLSIGRTAGADIDTSEEILRKDCVSDSRRREDSRPAQFGPVDRSNLLRRLGPQRAGHLVLRAEVDCTEASKSANAKVGRYGSRCGKRLTVRHDDYGLHPRPAARSRAATRILPWVAVTADGLRPNNRQFRHSRRNGPERRPLGSRSPQSVARRECLQRP
jgi:hypothetical protein